MGRGGINYQYKGEVFYVETNNFCGKGNDVDIFYKGIKLPKNDRALSDKEKKEIADSLRRDLAGNGIIAEILAG